MLLKLKEYIKVVYNPFYISVDEKRNLENTSKYVYNLVNDVLKEKLNDKTEVVNLMRIDYAWDKNGNLKVLELNTAGQQGWILIKESEKRIIKENTLSPDPEFLSKYLKNKLGDKIAIISNYIEEDIFIENDVHSNIELTELRLLINKIRSIDGKCKIINFDNDIIDKIKDYSPTGLYWRGNHSIKKEMDMLFKKDIAKKIGMLNIPQIPSLGSLFVSDNKSFLKYLKEDPKNVIPKTFNPSKDNIKFLSKNDLVLKPDNSSAGENIIFGEDCNEKMWNDYLKNVLENPNDWVLQQRCELKKDKNGKYIDIAVYIADGVVKGFISRTSKDKIVNIGNGGSLKPVILNDETYIKNWKIEYIFIFISFYILFVYCIFHLNMD